MSRRTYNRENKGSVRFSKLTLHKLDWLEWTTIGLAIWFFIYPVPYKILLGVLLIIPILGLTLNGLHKPSMASLVKISVQNGEDKYDVADFIDIAAWVILVRVLIDYTFESFYSMIIPGTIAFAIILLILFFTHQRIEESNRNKCWIYTSLIFNVCLYSYAGTYAANCAYDYSEPVVYKTAILDKYTYTSRKGGKRYYLEVAPWGHHYDKEKIKVSLTQYNETSVGDTINIDLKSGLFNIPWYFIETENN